MEKKVTKKFYYISAINIIPALIMGQLNPLDTFALVAIVVVLMLNHLALVKMIASVSTSMTSENNDAKQALKKTLFLIASKMLLLAIVIAFIYFYNQALILKVALLVIFQLIIQVVSIKNNY